MSESEAEEGGDEDESDREDDINGEDAGEYNDEDEDVYGDEEGEEDYVEEEEGEYDDDEEYEDEDENEEYEDQKVENMFGNMNLQQNLFANLINQTKEAETNFINTINNFIKTPNNENFNSLCLNNLDVQKVTKLDSIFILKLLNGISTLYNESNKTLTKFLGKTESEKLK